MNRAVLLVEPINSKFIIQGMAVAVAAAGAHVGAAVGELVLMPVLFFFPRPFLHSLYVCCVRD